MKLLILLLIYLIVKSESNNEESAFLKVIRDTKLESKDQIHEKGIGENFCLAHCHFQKQCHSINYHAEQRHCIVNLNSNEEEKESLFVTSIGWKYFEKSPKRKVSSITSKICGVSIKPLGCYGDNGIDRALPTLLGNYRSRIDWKQYQASLTELICDCVNQAKERNMRFIGLQYYGECYGASSGVHYDRHGISTSCVNSEFNACFDPTISDICSGKDNTNYVYEIL